MHAIKFIENVGRVAIRACGTPLRLPKRTKVLRQLLEVFSRLQRIDRHTVFQCGEAAAWSRDPFHQ
ncbi:MAG: hypothetical protein U0892_12805 [Pirellulales bacterium]